MYIRLTLNAFGEQFNAQNSIAALTLNNFKATCEDDTPNHISFQNAEAIVEYWNEAYEDDLYQFIVENIEILHGLGADDFNIFIDIYKYEQEQCNFEILSPKFFHYINLYKIRLPISVYTDESLRELH